MQFFITATGTDIGKTFFVENFCRQLIKEGKKIKVIKPVISGFDDADENGDLHKILRALNKIPSQENFNEISLYRFKEPLSPNIAAAKENQKIDFEKIVQFCQEKIDDAQKNNHHLLIEGAGGVMTPISDDKTFADLISVLKIPAILIAGNYLGTISHTLTAVKALQSYNIEIAKIILNCRKDDKISAQDNLRTLNNFTKHNPKVFI